MTIEYKITIRFDGLDAEEHEIDLFTLGESLQGIARVAGTVGNLVATQEYSRYFRSHELKVLAKESRANCFSIDVVFEFIRQQQMLSGAFPAALTGLIAWLLHRATKKDTSAPDLSSQLLETLKELAGQNAAQTNRLLGIMERMVVDLRPSLRQAFAPVGVSCRTLTIIAPQRSDTYDETDKAALLLPLSDEITDLQDWVVLITELDLERGTCKARITTEPEDRRINAIITDPLLKQLNSPYTLAMAAGEPLPVRAKAHLQDGNIKRLYISDVGI
ncbi:hypothetical protein [Cognatiluteimonas telluris]|uniref:DUF7946 domain-containing protein n=1 Tax=Cognatiluteimonas telluris TaxID=1104775 RepID=UPI00140D79C5|nr:hypothetical protein [Lysobacter telluris]